MSNLNNETEKSEDFMELLTPWILALLSILTVAAAILRMFSTDGGSVIERFDTTTLSYLVVAAGILLFRSIKTFSFGDVKLEMLEKVQERQAKQENKLDDIELIIPLLLPKSQQKHLVNLIQGKTNYTGRGSLQYELRRLASNRLIKRKRTIEEIKTGAKIDLADYVELTNLGKRWARRIKELEQLDAEKNLQNEA